MNDTEGTYAEDGGWTAAPGSPFRSLTAAEVRDAEAAAERTRPAFTGEHNAAWQQQHPVMRAVWGRAGHAPGQE